MSSIYEDFFWKTKKLENLFCSRFYLRNLAERQNILRPNCKIACYFVMKLLQLYFQCLVNPCGLGTLCAWQTKIKSNQINRINKSTYYKHCFTECHINK